ncbi:SDR family NAD(P)-dependent oxidoreductase [Streptomyces violascens]|uniref:SDR family NAD(P)-dependent oxidoreductase n=1 Tax=Streptomyces violascens TaxID=67381 RepID=UPI0036814491
MSTFAGKTALVTGASRGIGRATAERLAEAGALVAVHYGHSEQAAADTVAAIKAKGGSAFTLRAELGVPGDTDTLWQEYDRQILDHAPSAEVDILVNNAGITPRGHIEETTPELFAEAFAVNVQAPFFLTQAGLKRLRDGGRIINVSSGATRIALTDIIAYGMTKGALDTLTLTLAKELGPRGITVNSVAPGIIDTDLNAGWLRGNAEAQDAAAQLSALGRVGTPEDVADIVAFLASDAARWITGQVVDATGGSQL